MVEELDGGEDVGLAGKELVEQAVMQFRVEVGATVLEDDYAVIGVGGFEESEENDAAGGDAEEDEGIYVVGAQDHLKVGAGKGADAVLGDDHVVRLGSYGGMDRAGGALKQLLVPWRGLDRAEKEIARTDFREIWAEADLHVDDAHPGGTRALQDAGGTGEEFRVLHVDGDDAGLHVHAEDGGASGIEGECVRHGGSFFCNDDRRREDNSERRSSQRKNKQETAQNEDPRVRATRGAPKFILGISVWATRRYPEPSRHYAVGLILGYGAARRAGVPHLLFGSVSLLLQSARSSRSACNQSSKSQPSVPPRSM
jgi:hypothetical protein